MPRGMRALVLITSILCVFMGTDASAMKGDPCNAKFMDKDGNLRPDKVRAYTMHELFDIYRKADTNCDGHLSESEIRQFEKDQKLQAQIELTKQYVHDTIASGKPIHLDKDGEPIIPIVAASVDPSPDPCPPGWSFLLRNSAENIGTFSCPKDFKSATGAQFGYSRDGVAGNTSWSGKGFAALTYVWRNPTGDAGPYVAGYAISPWLSFNRLTNSLQSLKSKEVDLLSYGGTAELALAQVLGGTQYLRVKTQFNSDFEGDTKSWSATAEWQPVSNELGLSVPNPLGPYLVWELDPILRSIYSKRLNGSQDPIFAARDDVFRVGPVLALSITPIQNDAVFPHWLQTAAFSASYEWLNDVYSGHTYQLLNTALNFPIDPTSHLGLQIGYQYGRLEETGQRVNLATAGLSAKW